MTYPNAPVPTDSDQTEATEVSTVDKVKTLQQEGSERAKRVFEILKNAYQESRTEFQAGKEVIAPLTKEVTAEAVASMQEKRQQASEMLNSAWHSEAEELAWSDRLSKLLKALTEAAQQQLFPSVQKQAQKYAGQMDDLLEDRYGDRYAALKERVEIVRDWVIVPEDTDTDHHPTDDSEQAVIEVKSEVVK